jgi:long-subunit fatty acid transport protein
LGTGYFAAGSRAQLDSHALTGLLRYKFNDNFSVHGGIRAQSISASASIPFISNYDIKGDSDIGFGYVAGVAYERPDIALRVSLTYNSKIEHENDTVESSAALGGPNNSVTTIETPQSLNLEFQTGIAANTLLFGGLRWTEYSAFSIAPANYGLLTGGAALLSYEDDIYTWSLGVGRKLNDTWSVSASLGYERTNGGFETNLGPADGIKTLALAAVYTRDNMKITTGIRYADIGNAQTAIPGVAPAGTFRDNKALALGVKVGFSF